MASVQTCELSDVIGTLPDIAPVSGQGTVDEEDGLFLCALGFEPRCCAIPQRLQDTGYRSARAIYIEYATNRDDNAVNLPSLLRHLGAVAHRVDGWSESEGQLSTRLSELLRNVASGSGVQPPRVTLDISVFSNRLVLKCMKALLGSDVHLRMLYAEAARYRPTKEEYARSRGASKEAARKRTDQGVGEIGPSEDYPGYQMDPLPHCVVLFPGFNPDRTRAVLSYVDASLLTVPGRNVIWALGVPHAPENRWRLDAVRELNAVPKESLQYEVSTFDYKETLTLLEQIRAPRDLDHNITIAPMGSKMQAVGTSLFCHMRPEARVVSTAPRNYMAAKYSEGCAAVWQIDFGPLGQLRDLLERVGTLSIDE